MGHDLATQKQQKLMRTYGVREKMIAVIILNQSLVVSITHKDGDRVLPLTNTVSAVVKSGLCRQV